MNLILSLHVSSHYIYNNNANLIILTKGWLVVPHRERTRERAPYKPPIDMAVKFYTYYCLFPTLGLLRLFLSHNQYAIALYCDGQVTGTVQLYCEQVCIVQQS